MRRAAVAAACVQGLCAALSLLPPPLVKPTPYIHVPRDPPGLPVASSTSKFWPVDMDFPGLQVLHEDPLVVCVHDLLSETECEDLIAAAASRQQRSMTPSETGFVEDEYRTSSDCRLEFEETVAIHERFSQLLQMPVSHFEPLKVSRYAPDQYFKYHHDSDFQGYEQGTTDCPTPGCNRVVTLFTYLRDCAEGGATVFPGLDLAIRPKRGLGVLHFPAELPPRGLYDPRVGHSGERAVDEKWICQQWGYPGPLVRSELGDAYAPTPRPGAFVWRAETAPDGETFYHASGCSRWDAPNGPEDWVAYADASSGREYFHHAASGRTQWEAPPGRQTFVV